ncbi:MAG: acyl-CoA dehydratase activase [Candidatus Cloacimonetes bacterium]|jgi:predicted CoA-substrate-specific enzyme activase|nr:acyl-CoA dehydratase activase [Candidatus Cloacimonadota bacterium]
MITIGIDLGSRMSKIVILEKNKILYTNVTDTGVNPKKKSEDLLNIALKETVISTTDIKSIYSTGYGRNIVPFSDKRISEISCHAKGANYFFPNARTIIDIGGQDSKIILVDESGHVKDFVMNDRCAAGSGKFLEVTATTLETTIDDLGKLSQISTRKIDINSTCVVFAESEIIGLIAEGLEKSDIINAIHRSISIRTKNLTSQLHWQKPIVFTGGVAKNSGMQLALSEIMGTKVIVPENSFITGALGAAIFAKENFD